MNVACPKCGAVRVLDEKSIKPSAFSLSSLFLLTVIVSVCLGATSVHPALGAFAVMFSLFGLGRTVALVNHRKHFGYSTTIRQKAVFFFKGAVVGPVGLIVACGATWMLLLGMIPASVFVPREAICIASVVYTSIPSFFVILWFLKLPNHDRTIVLRSGLVSLLAAVVISYQPRNFFLASVPLVWAVASALVISGLVCWKRNGRLSVLCTMGIAISFAFVGVASVLLTQDNVRAAELLGGTAVFCGVVAGILVLRRVWPWDDAFSA